MWVKVLRILQQDKCEGPQKDVRQHDSVANICQMIPVCYTFTKYIIIVVIDNVGPAI